MAKDVIFAAALEKAMDEIHRDGIDKALIFIGKGKGALRAKYYVEYKDFLIPVKVAALYAKNLYYEGTGREYARLRGGYKNSNSSGKAIEAHGFLIYRKNNENGDFRPTVVGNPDPDDIENVDLLHVFKIAENLSEEEIKKEIFIYRDSRKYARDALVRALALKLANGSCELCGELAPFFGFNDTPYLEGHHIRPRSQNGADTVDNIAALCPNCHRRIHYGSDGSAQNDRLRGMAACRNKSRKDHLAR